MKSITPERKSMAEQKSEDGQQPRNTNSTTHQPQKKGPQKPSAPLFRSILKVTLSKQHGKSRNQELSPYRPNHSDQDVHDAFKRHSAASKRKSVTSNELELQGMPLEGMARIGSVLHNRSPKRLFFPFFAKVVSSFSFFCPPLFFSTRIHSIVAFLFFAQHAVVKAHVAFFSKVRQAKQRKNIENATALTVQVWECPYETKS